MVGFLKWGTPNLGRILRINQPFESYMGSFVIVLLFSIAPTEGACDNIVDMAGDKQGETSASEAAPQGPRGLYFGKSPVLNIAS